MINKIESSIIKALFKPKTSSHKGDNGKLLIVGGSQKYHGAPLLAAKIAGKIVDLVYFSSTPENNEFIKEMKSELCEFIAVSRQEINQIIKKVDVVLIGPGLGANKDNQQLINNLLKKHLNKKFVLDADGLKMVDKQLLGQNVILTPHKAEFTFFFNLSATAENVVKAAKKYGCTIVLKGKIDYIADHKSQFKINATGNAGMTKGGTGDVLAGLIAALACKNDLFLSACAGVFINGLAGDMLKERVSYYYSASDLILEIPKIIKQYIGD
ncbi:MAG: NAD(P)H-hydrate dehydratase [Patescibacteria group bacterium]